jgi:hypothetical protein
MLFLFLAKGGRADWLTGTAGSSSSVMISGMARPTNIFSKPVGGKNIRSQIELTSEKALERMLFGSLGGASPVRKIDPKTGDVIAVIDPKNRPTSSKP